MTRFVTLERAADMLAGDHPEDFDQWAAILANQAEALHAVNYMGQTCRLLPGTPLRYGDHLTWRLPVAVFLGWCRANGVEPASTADPRAPANPSSLVEPTKAPDRPGRRAAQLGIIVDAILARGWAPLCIPRGGKAALKDTLCAANPPKLSDASFEHTWKAGSAQGVIRVEGHENYARRH
jgi:hypothetical protein